MIRDTLKGTNRRIIEAGVTVFAKKGYHGSNVQDVLQEANVSRATFYAYYKNKEDLFSTIIDFLLEEQSAYILDLQKSFLSTPDGITETVTRVIRTIELEAGRSSDVLKIFFDVILGSGTKAEQRFKKMQQVTLDHFTEMIKGHLQSQGYSSQGAKALAYMVIGGFSHVCKLILYKQMTKEDVNQLVAGINELLQGTNRIPSKHKGEIPSDEK